MEYPKYALEISGESSIYEFTSVGVKGNIEKIVEFEPTDTPLVYNLAFGDKVKVIKSDGSVVIVLDDTVKSENGDRDKVLATVAATVFSFTFVYVDRLVFFAGNNAIKTRLYRMAITKNYEELNKEFHIFGVIILDGNQVLVPFNGNTPFVGFVVKKRTAL